EEAAGADDRILLRHPSDDAVEADDAIDRAQAMPAGEPEAFRITPLQGGDVGELVLGQARDAAGGQIENADGPGDEAAIAGPAFEEGDASPGGIGGRALQLPGGLM